MKTKPSESPNVYSRWNAWRMIHSAPADPNHFFLYRYFVTSGALTRDEALFLQDVLSIANLPETPQDDEDFFFRCTIQNLWDSLRWEEGIQQRLIRCLKEKGLLETCRRGVPAKRWVRVDMNRLKAILEGKAGGE